MEKLYFILICLFIAGVCIGSFLSVIIFRIKNNENGIITGRSHCPKCKKPLRPIDLIPLLSFIINKGKCHFCKKKISKIYPLLELLCGLALPLNFIYFISNMEGINLGSSLANLTLSSFILIMLITIGVYDLISKEVPNIFLYSWIILSVLYAVIIHQNSWQNIIIAILIALSFFGLQILISRGKWLGSGDLFFAFGMAILLGYERLIVAIILSYILGSIICLILLGTKKLKRTTKVPFIPFLGLGTLIALYFGKGLFLWYMTNSLINFLT